MKRLKVYDPHGLTICEFCMPDDAESFTIEMPQPIMAPIKAIEFKLMPKTKKQKEEEKCRLN